MVVVALIYGTAFPALYVLGLIFCVVAHWIDRYNLLRTFAPPPPTSDRLVAQVLRVVVPCSILLHIVLAVFLFRAKASATAPATLMAYGRALGPLLLYFQVPRVGQLQGQAGAMAAPTSLSSRPNLA